MTEAKAHEDILLYVHVPFCRSKCSYCGFFSVPFEQSAWEVYLETLIQEIRSLACQEQGSRVVSLSFGGGTPSLMPPDALGRILETIRSLYHCSQTMEVTLEANPDSVSADNLRRLARLGVTRLSLGIQSFDDHQLSTLGRPHTAARAEEAILAARSAGFQNLNLDMLFGLPGQTPADWLQQLERACRFEPAHLSCYGLTLEPGTPLLASVEAGKLELPAEEDQRSMFLEGRRFLARRGFDHYEISNFAREGRHCRHNLGYWTGKDYLGFGPGAVSTRHGARRRNPEDLDEYVSRGSDGSLEAGWTQLQADELANEAAMLRLRLGQGLNLTRYRQESGRDLASEQASLLQDLATAGLLHWSPDRIRLSPPGMLVSNSIISELFQIS